MNLIPFEHTVVPNAGDFRINDITGTIEVFDGVKWVYMLPSATERVDKLCEEFPALKSTR